MRVYLPFGGGSKHGKEKNMLLLGKELRKRGVNVTLNPNKRYKCNIYLAHMSFKHPIVADKRILRLEGFPEDVPRLMEDINLADGIIFQSKWSMRDYVKRIGKIRKPCIVLYNGDYLNQKKIKKYMPDRQWRYEFIAVATWNKNKNLKTTIKAVLKFPNAMLHVYGGIHDGEDYSVYENNSRIRFYGKKKRDKIKRRAKACVAGLHLSTVDCCPNSVVELLSVGCPVISANNGGGAELIKKGCGKIVDIYNENGSYDCVGEEIGVDGEIKLLKAMRESLSWRRVRNNKHINIERLAKKYIDFFQLVRRS